LVWTRPGAMSWGFFLYVMWFNPGQSFQFYALLQHWPLLLLAQNIAGCIAQGIGLTGLLLFVLRVPNDKPDPKWRVLERALPLIALVLTLLLLASYGSVFGYRTETGTRAGILMGFVVAWGALAILMVRRRTQTPEDNQRVRWVIWGCLIGLPSFLIAELAAETTLFNTRWGDFTPSDDIIGLLYLVNGILCLFVFEAVRRPRVVSVAIPLRRVTILGLILSAPVLLLHHEVESIQRHLALPSWAWLALGAFAVFLISRLHEDTVAVVDRFFNRALDRLERTLSQAMREAQEPADIDRLLAEEASRALKLSSAATFRRQGSYFVRDEDGKGWEGCATRELNLQQPMLAAVSTGEPFGLEERDDDGIDFPPGLRRPVLGVPAADPVRCFALSLYGPHAVGTDLNADERAMLSRLARFAAAMYAELEAVELRHRNGSSRRGHNRDKHSPPRMSALGH
jgi:tryptophan-rich sensory protein